MIGLNFEDDRGVPNAGLRKGKAGPSTDNQKLDTKANEVIKEVIAAFLHVLQFNGSAGSSVGGGTRLNSPRSRNSSLRMSSRS